MYYDFIFRFFDKFQNIKKLNSPKPPFFGIFLFFEKALKIALI